MWLGNHWAIFLPIKRDLSVPYSPLRVLVSSGLNQMVSFTEALKVKDK